MITWKAVKTAASPYMVWIKVGLYVVLASALFVGGCNYGESKSAQLLADQGQVISTLNLENTTLRQANATYEEDVLEANKTAAANRKFAEEQAKEAEAAARRARQSQLELVKNEQKWKRAFSDAMNDRRCAELMEMQVCEIAPMP